MDVPGMQKALLKNVESSDTIDSSVIQVLDYGFKTKRDIEIKIEQPEFTSRCPLSGLPDFGCITIRYTPDDKIIELKSLKYYLLQYRNVGIFYEHVVNQIIEDLVARVHPKHMEVLGNFTSRGGITTTAQVNFNAK